MNGNGMHITLARKEQLVSAKPDRYTALRKATDQLSLRNADAAIVELLNEAMQRLTLLAYEQDADGYCNIDGVTGKLLIPAPWGKSGYKRWALRPTESIVLREMVQQRQIGRNGRGPGLWLYDGSRRCWRLNLYDYDALADGQNYWQRWGLGVGEYRQATSRRLGDR